MKNTKPSLVLLGAGASVPAGMPTAVGMTDKMIDICKEESRQDYTKALWAIIGALQMGIGQAAITKGVDIERVLNAASLLGERFALEFAPFIGAWHPIIDELEHQQLSGMRKKDADFGLQGGGFYSSRLFSNLHSVSTAMGDTFDQQSRELLNKVVEYMSQRPDGTLFRDLNAFLHGKLIDLTWIKTAEHLSYLDPLIECGRDKVITIATLNYDNSIERRTGSLKGIKCETGINEWAKTGSFSELQTGIDLIKLHGSVKWYWSGPQDQSSLGLHPREFQEVSDEEMESIANGGYHVESAGKQLGAIFGGHNKLTAAGPFLELLVKFKKALDKASRLIVIGYSFRDKHVNHCIASWIHYNQNQIVVIDKNKALFESHIDLATFRATLKDRFIFESIGAEEGIKKYFSNQPN